MPTVQPPYTINPGTLTAKYVAGYPATINATASQTTTFVGVVYVKPQADSDIITSAQVTPNSDGSIALAVATSASAAPGHYAGNITVNVCKDTNCAAQLEGAPFKVPYAIDVVSPNGGVTTSNLAPLATLGGAGDWSGYQANAAHTGMVPVTLNPSAFSLRWKYEAPAVSGRQMVISDIASGNGHLYFSTGSYYDASAQGHLLFVLNERDGSQAWTHDFGDLKYATTNPPAYANGKVYLSAGSQESTTMFAFDANSGAPVFSTPINSQWSHYRAPVAFGDSIYMGGGYYGGMYAFDAASGAQQWFVDADIIFDWAPAVDAGHAYLYVGGRPRIFDRLSGALTNPSSAPDVGGLASSTPLLGAPNNLIVSRTSGLTDYDTAALAVRWTVAANFHDGAAYDRGVIYALRLNPVILEARNEGDGSLAWSWTAPAAAQDPGSNVVLTNNLVFVSANGATYAVDRSTHAAVWTYPFSGQLSLSSNGILYINGGTSIAAINLH
ncbi:PQQ-binding-like beta-propeller repeat protein [Duganella sp. LX20W]|uniref:PQQ-binding-like beta-propeller repeat protein n=1 Tax=Rugamonas brunnea TaxID=2758569 RepID=A0A7W2ICP7_9BURK|nr:PQQ-binding-like beta-propeller repeat protein [Rugamonas brunnea]MBA5638579.1 PQQ-binding-like beta-propeller repeat protein [Rugamonas brunnea]